MKSSRLAMWYSVHGNTLLSKYFTLHNFLGLFSLACNMAGSMLIAANSGQQLLGYVFFLVGVIPATYLMIVSNVNKTLLLTNIYFFVVNIFGIYNYWGT